MPESAVITAVFSDFKLVKTRSVAQLVFEVPSELGKAALDTLGGLPNPGSEAHVAIARLVLDPPKPKEPSMNTVEKTPEQLGREAVAQAGICANEAPFQAWILGERYTRGDRVANEMAAAREIRVQLGVQSRKEIRTDPEKLAEWQALYTRYQASLAAA